MQFEDDDNAIAQAWAGRQGQDAAQAEQAVADAGRALRKAERRLRAALDVLPEGIVLLDEHGRYIHWNEEYARIYHKSADLFLPGIRLADTLRMGIARGDYPEAAGREEEWLAVKLMLKNEAAIERPVFP